jgi:hypothetical protein
MLKTCPYLMLAAVAACGTQSDDHYQGEPLAVLRGQVVTQETAPPPADSVNLAWMGLGGRAPTVVAEEAPVTGTFPAEFELDLFAPPPTTAINNLPDLGGQFGISFIASLDPTSDLVNNPVIWGMAEHHMLAYLPATIEANTMIAEFLGGVTAPGYHLMQDVPEDASTPEHLEEVPMSTAITVRLAPMADLHAPNPCCLMGSGGGGSGSTP